MLFLFAVCAAHSASSGGSSSSGRRSSYGRSHSRHHEPRDYRGHRSRHGGDYGRRSGSHGRLRESSAEISDGSSPSSVFGTIDVGAKLGNTNKDHGSNLGIDAKFPGVSNKNVGAGSINVVGALPNDNSVNDFPNIGDDIIKPFGNHIIKPIGDDIIKPIDAAENAFDSANTIKVDGMKPNNFPVENPINVGGKIDVGGLSPIGIDGNPNNGHSIAVDGLLPKPDNLIPKTTPSSIHVSGKIPNEQGYDNGNINVNGLSDDNNNHGKLPNESGDIFNNNQGSINVNGLPDEENNVNLGEPSYNNTDKCSVEGKCNDNPKEGGVAENRPKEEPSYGHNTIAVNGIFPEDGNTEHKIDEDVTKKPIRPINPHDSFPDLTTDKPINVGGLLPGGDGNKPGHSFDDNGALTNPGNSNLNNVDGFQPTGHKPNTHDINNNNLPTGAGNGISIDQNNNKEKPINGHFVYPGIPDNHRPSPVPGKVDKEGGNNNDKPFIMPVYLPNDNGHVIFPGGVMSQNGKVPAYYVVMINGKATLVRNPSAGNGGSSDGIDITSILGQEGGAGGISIGGGIGLPIMVGSRYPNFGGFKVGNGLPSSSMILNGFGNVPSALITGEQPVNVEHVITEQVSVPQPVITEQIQVPQPIYNIPLPNGPYGYPNMPYPYPWPSMWDNMNTNMNWPNMIEFLVNLGAHQNNDHNKQTTNPPISGEKNENEYQKPKKPAKDEIKPTTKRPIYVKPTERTTLRTTVKSTEAPIITKATAKPFTYYTKQPFKTQPTSNPTIYITNPTERTPMATKYTPSPVLTRATVATTHATAATPHDEYTKPQDINQEKIPTDMGNNKGNDLHIPLRPGFKNDESKMTSGPYDPTLINLLNVVLKVPNKSSYPKPKPSEDHESLKELLESILKPNSGDKHEFVPNQRPRDEDNILKFLVDLLKSKPENKEFKELLELLKSRPGDKAIKDLLEILKSKPGKKALNELIVILQQKTGGKRHPFHEILGFLNQNDDRNEPNIAILCQLLLNILNSRNSQPSLNILVQEPGLDETTRSNLILLLNLLASSLGSEYSLGGAGMGIAGIAPASLAFPGIGPARIGVAGIGGAGIGGAGLGINGFGGVGMGLGGYEQVNPANLYFLGQFPCDFSNIRAGFGNQGLERNILQLLSRIYGHRANFNSLRLGRSAEEGDNVKPKPEK